MSKKLLFSFLVFYLLFIGFIYLYLFKFNTGEIPEELVGTSIDPATFLTHDELFLSEEYSNIRNFLFFLSIPYEWLFYLLILLLGFGKIFENLANNITKLYVLRSAIFTFCLSFSTYVFFFPLRYLSYSLSTHYGITVQSFSSWMKDGLIDFWVDWFGLFAVVSVVYWLMKKSEKRWWLHAWYLTIPFVLFLMFVQPVIIDPLYNDFTTLQNKNLEEKILALANIADIPAEHVYEVNMSEKTNSLNAYVTGIGSNSRIVLWDTTLSRLSEDEILFIMAHEMAHYVEKHIYFGIFGYLLFALFAFYMISKLFNLITSKYRAELKITSQNSFSSFPLIMLLLSLLLFIASPMTNAVSRYQEMRADIYAIELTKDVDAGVSTFHELTRAGLSQVNPPLLVKWFRYGHPTMKERIEMVENYRE